MIENQDDSCSQRSVFSFVRRARLNNRKRAIEMDQSFFSQELFGMPVLEWFKLLGLWLAFTGIFLLVRQMLFGRFSRMAERTENRVDDVVAELLRKTKLFFLLILALYLAVEILTQDAPAVDVIR